MPPLTFPSTPTVGSSLSPQQLPSSPPHPESPRDSPHDSQNALPPPPPPPSSPLPSPPSLQPNSTPTPQPHQYLLPQNPCPPFPLNLTTLPTPIRHKIISETSISTLLTLSATHPTLRTDIQTSNAITDTVFNSAHNFHTSARPPSVQKLLITDPYLHPLFAKAIAESFDGADALSEDLTSGEYFSWLQQRCYVVHLIDQCFSEIEGNAKQKGKGKSVYCGIEGTKRKIILLQFWRLLDCIENWSVSISASLDGIQDGFKLTADDYFGWCVDFVNGFKHATLSDEEREDLSEVVGFFMEIPPMKLVKGGGRKGKSEGESEGENQDCFWKFLGMRCIVQGFCLLGGLERVVGALYGNYPLAEMRGMGKEEGMEREISRGIGKWVEWERDRAERRMWDARGSRKGVAKRKKIKSDKSDHGDCCDEGQDKNGDMKEGGNGDWNGENGDGEVQDKEEKMAEDIVNNDSEFVLEDQYDFQI
ncbi:hypothetical protein B9Z19DRAFT_1060519 [Tuber borchii]|uniref:F-box domain-containing protein n=1 Tax=Tuber borchii TaxID=42251 RepID=A0A2T7A8R7_TUBBO|nr:hypothetical protein B9Z19DRAFT_1060519 [Tuber borchii]